MALLEIVNLPSSCEHWLGASHQLDKEISNLSKTSLKVGIQIKYGDTDSLYLVPPERCFQECDEAYDNGNRISKEEY